MNEAADAMDQVGSSAPGLASTGPRLGAAVVDQVLVLVCLNVVVGVMRIISGSQPGSVPGAAGGLFVAAYFTLTEGLAGASAGKWIFGLRVSGVEGGGAGFVRIVVRTALFSLAAQGLVLIPNGVLIRAFVPSGLDIVERGNRIAEAQTWLSFLNLFAPSILFLTARSRNGFAGLHELLSGTRVTTRVRATPQTLSDVPRWSRALLPTLIGVVLFAITLTLGSMRVSTVSSDERPLLNSLIRIEQLRRSVRPESDPERRALEIYVAGRYAPLSARAASFGGELRPFRQLAHDIAVRHRSVSDADLLVALRQLGPDRLDRVNRDSPMEGVMAFVLRVVFLLLPGVASVAVFSLLLAFVFRGGVILRLFGLAVVDAAGAEVARWRALWRAAVGWSPLIALQLLPLPASMTFDRHPMLNWAIVAALGVAMAVGICWAIVVPARGLHDRLAGVCLAPRSRKP
jgi:hypothetical protein